MNELEPQSTIVMKELSDIKEKLATNTANTDNVLGMVKELKSDLKTYSALFITHEEFKSYATASADYEFRLRSLESKVWRAIGALVICQVIILPVILYLFFRIIK